MKYKNIKLDKKAATYKTRMVKGSCTPGCTLHPYLAVIGADSQHKVLCLIDYIRDYV